MPWPDRRRPWRIVGSLRRLALWARRRRTEIIHCEHDLHPFGSLLARLLRVPLVTHVHFGMGRGFCEWAFRGRRAPN
ncbi:MAG TPA: glycosyltransferase, partial [Pirellulales bacterium]|nr:glycosyltransferase [Pirellulales bacterium]